MARLRFPGRPGQRIGKNYVKYVYDDIKFNNDICNPAFHKFELGLKLFYDLFGYSDEEEDFEGFSVEDIAQAEASVAQKSKQKEAIQRLFESSNGLSSPATSEIDKLCSSSDSDTSTFSIRQERGMRNIVRKSYDKMIKDGLKSNVSSDTVCNDRASQCSKPKLSGRQSSQSETRLKTQPSMEQMSTVYKNLNKSKSNILTDSNLSSGNKMLKKNSLVRHLLEKAKHQGKSRRGRRKNMQPTLQKKFRKHYIYQTSMRKKIPTIEKDESIENKMRKKSSRSEHSIAQNVLNFENNNSVNVERRILKPKLKRSFSGHKRFILPSMSARSSRKIIPRKRYIDEYDLCGRKMQDEDSHCSRSSLSGSSETISAMDGGSSPEDTQIEDSRYSKKYQKKIGLLDRPLVIEGKRQWKPSLKVQMKLSEMNYEYPFGLKKNDDSSGTGASSGSFKDIIMPDMVSKYAEKMAQKPKDRPFKILESFKKSASHSVKSEPEKAESSDDMDDDRKPEDKLEKVAAKIEKLLKSQWEGRLKESSLHSSAKMPSKFDSAAQWKNEHQQRTSTQKRTKNIIRKARLQLKKKNLNLRARKSNKDFPLSNDDVKNKDVKNKPGFSEKTASAVPKLPIVNQSDVPSKNLSCVLPTNACETAFGCVVCGFSKLYVHGEKLHNEASCGACSRFFDTFAKSPKQYFCTKDGNCSIDRNKDSASRKLLNSRCKACWLKLCMEKFTVSAVLRDQLSKYVPRLDAPPHNPLIIVENVEPTEHPEDGQVRGPRIKHVCRRAAVVLGLPRATFPDLSESKESFHLSALPQEEKQKILETIPLEEKVTQVTNNEIVATTSEIVTLQSSSKDIKQMGKKKSHKDLKIKNSVHMDLMKKSSVLIHKEQKRRKLLMKKSMKHSHKHSFKKSLKVGSKNEMKKTLKFSYKSAVKTSLKTSPKVVSRRPLRTGKFRKMRCKQCEGCLAEDCGECACAKFGGPNLIKQACIHRRCLRPIMPVPDQSSKPSHYENDKGKPSGGNSSFGGDGPSGIGLSLSSSSSSPTSPDGSSCGSSCSSSSSSSSSGSSGSSSSSSSSHSSTSTSSSSSSSDNITVPHNNVLVDSCSNVSFMQSIVSEPVILQESECTDNNIVTNTIFQELGFNGESYSSSSPSLHELVTSSFASPQQRMLYSNQVIDGPLYKETGDTIFYDDSSSIIELKNASFAPSLIYGASIGDTDDSVSYSSNTGSKNQNSRQGTSDSRKPHYSKEQDQYGSAGSGGQESNEDDDDDDGDDDDEKSKKKKHYIYADYWEDYDFDRISSQGYALISSQQMPLPCVCYLCGSAGEEKLIFCVLCCEPYHTFCLPEDDIPYEENLENWCCKRCQCCAVCGLKQNLLKCKKCQCTYHAECLTPHYPTKPSRKKRVWMCPKCVKCKSCGTTSPASSGGISWNFDLNLCQPCAKLTDKDEGYEILFLVYLKQLFIPVFDVLLKQLLCGKKAIKEYLKHGLKSVLNSVLSARCARHLIKPVESSSSISIISNNLNCINKNESTEKTVLAPNTQNRS
ncbi:hypothetical protein CEXT_389471 [Caerostris extrusa]|uniref:Uncharacterized protein n=1 Tax=Caerostris extrusa TaxID=172846 RepID=A0AAV4PZU9_CAEEX|nr:hypothetical protein CEXT_389471 [Caerostris extrusa]